jgi:hypothetical protein
LIRLSVQRWSSAKPCASGPRLRSCSSRAHCRGDSLSRDTGPRDFSATVPLVPPLAPLPPPPHRTRRDPQLRGDLPGTVPAREPLGRPRRTRSRRCCSAGVYPPHCAYRMPPSYDGATRRHYPQLPGTTSSTWLVSSAITSPIWIPLRTASAC